MSDKREKQRQAYNKLNREMGGTLGPYSPPRITQNVLAIPADPAPAANLQSILDEYTTPKPPDHSQCTHESRDEWCAVNEYVRQREQRLVNAARALLATHARETAPAEPLDCLRKLCDKLDRVDEDTKSIFGFAQCHGMKYTGANWVEEYNAARECLQRAALAPAPAAETEGKK